MLCLQLDSMAARFAQTSEEEREKKMIDLQQQENFEGKQERRYDFKGVSNS